MTDRTAGTASPSFEAEFARTCNTPGHTRYQLPNGLYNAARRRQPVLRKQAQLQRRDHRLEDDGVRVSCASPWAASRSSIASSGPRRSRSTVTVSSTSCVRTDRNAHAASPRPRADGRTHSRYARQLAEGSH